MDVSQALNIINDWKPNQIETLADLLPLELINDAYALSDTVTLRKRKLSLESLVWLLVGMALYNVKSIADIVNQLDIVDREGKPFVAPSAHGVSDGVKHTSHHRQRFRRLQRQRNGVSRKAD